MNLKSFRSRGGKLLTATEPLVGASNIRKSYIGQSNQGCMKREYYSDSIANFRGTSPNEILGILAKNNEFPLEQTQRDAWLEEIDILQKVLPRFEGTIYFEYSIPRMGKRIDVVLLIGSAIFVLEFKIGEKEFLSYAIDQVWDYALDLKKLSRIEPRTFDCPHTHCHQS